MSELKSIKYEYETIHIMAGGTLYDSDLIRLGSMSYRLIAILPLTRTVYDGEEGTKEIPNGSQVIFERENISEENI